jgi:thymidylate synthase (FAD)
VPVAARDARLRARYAIRAHAEVMPATMNAFVSLAYRAFIGDRLAALTRSAQMRAAVRLAVAGDAMTQADGGLSRRE